MAEEEAIGVTEGEVGGTEGPLTIEPEAKAIVTNGPKEPVATSEA